MKKKIFYISSILAIVLFTACSDNKKTDEPKSIAKEATASGIEIVNNNHAKDIKVGLKDHNGTDNKYYFNYGVKSAYDQNAQPANDDASVRIRPRTAIQANMNIRSTYEKWLSCNVSAFRTGKQTTNTV